MSREQIAKHIAHAHEERERNGYNFPYNADKPFHSPIMGEPTYEDAMKDYRFQRDHLNGGTAEGSNEQRRNK